MKVKQMSENRIYWSLGRGEGDQVLGVELSLEGGERLRRTVFSRGKFGKERTVMEEVYTAEEFSEILSAETALLTSPVVEGGDARRLLSEAMDRIRRVYDGF